MGHLADITVKADERGYAVSVEDKDGLRTAENLTTREARGFLVREAQVTAAYADRVLSHAALRKGEFVEV